MACTQTKIEHVRAQSRKAIQMRFEGIVQNYVSGFNMEAPLIPSFFVGARKDKGRVAFLMAMTEESNPANYLPCFHRMVTVPVCLSDVVGATVRS